MEPSDQQSSWDFKAELRFKSTADGGRLTPFRSGNIINTTFDGDLYVQWGAKTEFIDGEWLHPGGVTIAFLRFISEMRFVKEGSRFQICEGEKVVGEGIVLNDFRQAK